MKKKVKHISTKTLHKKAWNLQSQFLRRIADGQCFTCKDKRDWKEQQAGHYIHKNCVDYDPINIHCQCVHCNLYLSGNSGIYAEKLIKKYGELAVADLRWRSTQVKKFTITELEDLIDYYKRSLEVLDGKGKA